MRLRKKHSAHSPIWRKSATEETKINNELKQIYSIDAKNHTLPDMSRLETMTRPVLRRVLVSALFILIALAAGLAGAVLLNRPFSSNPDDMLAFEVKLPDEVKSGTPLDIIVLYENPTHIPIADAGITVELPKSFMKLESTPGSSADNPYLWKIGAIPPNGKGEIVLRGSFITTPGIPVTVQAIARFQPSNFSAWFEDIASASSPVVGSNLEITLEGPDKVATEEPTAFKVQANNVGYVTQENVEVTLNLPIGFSLKESVPPRSQETSPVWTVGIIEPGATWELQFTGVFSSDQGGERAISAQVGIKTSDTYTEQAKQEVKIEVVGSEMSLVLLVNSERGEINASPGESLGASIILRNNGEETAENIRIELIADTGAERLDFINRTGSFPGTKMGTKLVWNSNSMSRLTTLRGGEEAVIDIVIPTSGGGPDTVLIHAVAKVESVGGVMFGRNLSSSSLKVSIASDAKIQSSAYYYNPNGSPAGSGPLPPKVGNDTTYQVKWQITNPLHAINQTTITAPLPPGAVWAGAVSASIGNIAWDSVLGKVRWAPGQIPASGRADAVFNIQVKPTSSDLGKFMNLLGQTTLVATDAVTMSSITSTFPPLTSDLPSDPGAKDKGVVMGE